MSGALVLAYALALSNIAAARDSAIPSERIHFGAGKASATRKGRIRGYDARDYVLNAAAGQTMSVKLASSSPFAYFSVFDKAKMDELETDPRPSEVTEWSGVLPRSGDYVVRVYLVRAEARRHGVAAFTLTVSITDGARARGKTTPDASEGSDAMVATPADNGLTSTEWVLES